MQPEFCNIPVIFVTFYVINIIMIQYIDYLNWPQLPSGLVGSYEDIIQRETVTRKNRPASNFQPKMTDNSLLETWCQLYIPVIAKKIRYQVMPGNVGKHKDSGNRQIAFNYILVPGGSKVLTSIFDDEFNLIERKCIEPNRWHYIAVNRYHSVINIEQPRLSLSITPCPEFQREYLYRLGLS